MENSDGECMVGLAMDIIGHSEHVVIGATIIGIEGHALKFLITLDGLCGKA